MFNEFPTPLKVEFGRPVDIWSMGCLVGLRDEQYGTMLTYRKLYELATSMPLISWGTLDGMEALHELTAILGPLPEEWVCSLGM